MALRKELTLDDEAGPSLSSGAKPWKGITVTFTGVEEKPKLSALVKELGGKVENALTVNVTHVIASGFGSAKYMYAIEHRLPVLAPSWVEDAHKHWVSGAELDVPAVSYRHGSKADNLERRVAPATAVHGAQDLDLRYRPAGPSQDNHPIHPAVRRDVLEGSRPLVHASRVRLPDQRPQSESEREGQVGDEGDW